MSDDLPDENEGDLPERVDVDALLATYRPLPGVDADAIGKAHGLGDQDIVFGKLLASGMEQVPAALAAGFGAGGVYSSSAASKRARSTKMRKFLAALESANANASRAQGDLTTEQKLDGLAEIARTGKNEHARILASKAHTELIERTRAQENSRLLSMTPESKLDEIAAKHGWRCAVLLAERHDVQRWLTREDVKFQVWKARREDARQWLTEQADTPSRQAVVREFFDGLPLASPETTHARNLTGAH